MRIEVAEHARMSERGSSLLRLIQNNDMPILDLLVRESVQNSMDAALPGDGCIDIAYRIGDFRSADVSRHLEGIEENLNRRFPEESYKLLEIRDSNTTGLTGPLHYNEVKDDYFGNLLKLVYEISMPQQQEGSGGSWGLGKTVYFRIGIGLVFYYTRIQDENGEYASRLAACLVEDERSQDALISSNDGRPKRGIAWWGQPEGFNSTKPLTDEEEIEAVLRDFNTEPYVGEETGTTIIIPYIDEDKLLQGILPSEDSEDQGNKLHAPWWTKSVPDYLTVALQRWYAPRLMNKKYGYGRWLRAKVNAEGIEAEKMLPLFKVAQALYNRTPLVRESNHAEDILKDVACEVKQVRLRNIFQDGTCAGYISFVKLTKEQLLMKYPDNNPSPFIQANKFDVESGMNPPLIMYVRKPGMIVGYETTGQWTEGIPRTGDNEFIIGIFVANSSNILKNLDSSLSIEEYIRKSEKADHTSWSDWNIGLYKPYIVSKMQKHAVKHITTAYVKETREPYTKRNNGLGRVLADILLPPENFGSSPGTGPKPPRGGERVTPVPGKGRSLKIVGSPIYESGKISLDFELSCGRKAGAPEIHLQILSESGSIEAEKWESEEVIGTEFPMELHELKVTQVKNSKKQELSAVEYTVNKQNPICSDQGSGLAFEVLKTQKFEVPYGVKLKIKEAKGQILYGRVSFSTKDGMVKGSLALVQDEGGKR